jgi:hypothetical protein
MPIVREFSGKRIQHSAGIRFWIQVKWILERVNCEIVGTSWLAMSDISFDLAVNCISRITITKARADDVKF